MGVYLIRSRFCLNLVIAILATILGPASIATCEPKHHVLAFSGEGFAFVVKEPPGWFADTTIAREFGADVIFYPAAGDPHSSGTPMIRVLVIKKTSEDTGAELKHYVDHSRSSYRNIEFRDSVATHPHYRAYAKLLCAPGKFCEYVTYLNPGPSRRLLLSVTLNKPGRPATSTELAAYRKVVASIALN